MAFPAMHERTQRHAQTSVITFPCVIAHRQNADRKCEILVVARQTGGGYLRRSYAQT